jgi:hypothetical protein
MPGRLVQLGQDIVMAPDAKLLGILAQERFMTGAMRTMALEAFPLRDGVVRSLRGFLVAGEAQLVRALRHECEGLGRCRILVTRIAAAFRNGRMNRAAEELHRIGRVGRVALRAVRIGDGVATMRLDELILVRLVAF